MVKVGLMVIGVVKVVGVVVKAVEVVIEVVKVVVVVVKDVVSEVVVGEVVIGGHHLVPLLPLDASTHHSLVLYNQDQ